MKLNGHYLSNNTQMPVQPTDPQIARSNVSNAIKPTVPTQIAPPQAGEAVSSTASANETLASTLKGQTFAQAPISYSYVRDIKLPFSDNAKLFKLANGQKIAVLEKKGPTVLQTYFNVGSMNELDSERGISHFNEHMAFNGSKSPFGSLGAGDFFKIVNEMGAMTNASTGFAQTDYYVSSQLLGQSNTFDKTAYIQSQQLQFPEHTNDMIEKEKGPVTSEISMVADQPENMVMNHCIKNLFNIQSTSPDLVAGSIKNINNLTNKETLDYHNLWYTPDNCSTVVTGEVPTDEVMKTLSKYFNKTASADTSKRKYQEFKSITSPVRVDLKMPKAQCTTAAIALAGPQNNAVKENIELELLMTALLGFKSARINKELNKNQSSAMMNIERVGNKPTDPKAIIIASQSTPEKTEQIIKTIYNEIGNLTVNPLSADELESSKKILKMTYSKISENSQLLNTLLGNALLDDNLDYVENYIPILDKITSEDISAFAKKYLDLNKASVAVVHPETEDNALIMANYNNANLLKALPAQTSQPKISFKGNLNKTIEEKSLDLSKIKQYKLANNLETVFNPNQSDIASSKIVLETPVPANVKPAVSSLLSVILNEGSKNKNYDEFYGDVHKSGINMRFDADFKSISASVDSLSQDFGKSLDLIKEVFSEPRLNAESFNYAKQLVKEAVMNMPNSASEDALKLLFPNMPEFSTKEELLKSLDNTTLGDVQGLFDYIKNNAMAKAVFTAPIDKDSTLEQTALSKMSLGLGTFKPFAVSDFDCYAPINENIVTTKAEQRNQADITKSFKFKTSLNPKDQTVFSLMNTILGDGPSSRLFNDLREQRKLAYRVESGLDYVGNTGVLTMSIKTTTDDAASGIQQYENVEKSLNGFDDHIKKITKEKVSIEELDAAKLRMKTKLLNSIESSASQTNILSASKDTVFGVSALNENLKLIDEITADDIYNAANYVFNGNSITSILASQNTLNNSKIKATAAKEVVMKPTVSTQVA